MTHQPDALVPPDAEQLAAEVVELREELQTLRSVLAHTREIADAERRRAAAAIESRDSAWRLAGRIAHTHK